MILPRHLRRPAIAALILLAALLTYSLLHRRKSPSDPNSAETPSAASPAATEAGPADRENATKGPSRRQPREDPAAQAKALAARLIPLAAKSLSGAQPDAGDEAASLSLMAELARLDSPRFQLLIAEISQTPDLTDALRAQTCGFLLARMANVDPAAALDLFTSMQPLMQKDPQAGVSIITLLDTVSGTDPVKAADWLTQHPEALGPGPQLDEARSRILQGAAARDPALAFALMDRLQVDYPLALSRIASSAHTTAQRLSLLTALRNRTAGMPDPAAASALRSDMLITLGATMNHTPAAATREFLDAAHLSEADQAAFLKAHDLK